MGNNLGLEELWDVELANNLGAPNKNCVFGRVISNWAQFSIGAPVS